MAVYLWLSEIVKAYRQEVYWILHLFTIDLYFMGFTSTSMGNKESFLPHLGHFPL